MILFDEATHRYYDSEGDFISVTTLLDQYSEKFDSERMSVHIANKRGGTPEYWKKKWADFGEERADFGTEFHARKEELDGLQTKFGGQWVKTNNQWFLLQRLHKWNYLEQLPDGHYTELMFWHSGYRVSGTADRVLIETVLNKRYLHIEDHKTNEKLPQESYRHPTRGYKMLRPPVSHIMDCKFWKYHLQLSMYQFLAESMGFHPGERRILHYPWTEFEQVQGIKPTLEELLQREPVVHPVKYLKKEVFSICEDYQRRRKAA